jgi:glycerophosphoryl diester phosphodiesterase
MVDGVAIEAAGHRVWLKWHRLQRTKTDIPFTASRLAEGLALGASTEIDLRRHGESGFAVLHDTTLDRETTGSGPVSAASVATLKTLVMRRTDGSPTKEPLLRLDDLARLAAADAAPGTIVQLDLKETNDALNDATVAAFRETVAPVADRFILSGGDWAAVTRLGVGIDGLKIGFDPCHDTTIEQLATADDIERFVQMALDTAPEASMIYLDYRIVMHSDALLIDIIARFHTAGKTIDAYTLNADHPGAEAILRRLVELEADQITTDEPIVLQQLYESSSTSQA